MGNMPMIHLAGVAWAAGGLVGGAGGILWCVRQMILDRLHDKADRDRRELVRHVFDNHGGSDVLDAYARMLADNKPVTRRGKGRRR